MDNHKRSPTQSLRIMDKRIFLIFALALLVIPFGSAGYIPHEIDTDLDLSFSDQDVAVCNVSNMIYPNGSTLALDIEMSKSGQTFEATVLAGNLTTIGDTCFNIDCETLGSGSICRDVTQTGGKLDDAQALVIIGLFMVMVLLAVVFFYLGNKFEYKPSRIFLNSLGGLFLMFTVGISANIIQQLFRVGSVLEVSFNNLYTLMLGLTSAWGIGIVVYIVYVSVRQFYSYKNAIDGEID